MENATAWCPFFIAFKWCHNLKAVCVIPQAYEDFSAMHSLMAG